MTKTTTLLLLLAAGLLACEGKKTEKAAPQGEKPAATAPAGRAPAPDDFDAQLDAALAKGIGWLRAQAKDGMWYGPDGKGGTFPSVAHTALALAPIARSLTDEQRASDPLVKKAAAFILSNVQEDGAVRQGTGREYDNYFTSVALMALEAVNDPAQAEQREKMRDFILTLQRTEKDGPLQGGIGYDSHGGADLSNSQFAIEALRVAGIAEDDPHMQQALEYLERVQNRSENEANKDAVYEVKGEDGATMKVVPGNDGSAGYAPGASKAGMQKLPDGRFTPRGYGSMTYALLKCYILVGLDVSDPRVQAVLDWLAKNYGWDKNPGFDEAAKTNPEAPYWGLYYYYMTAAKALALTGLGTIETATGPRNWRRDLWQAISSRQQADGSWRNDKSPRWDEGDPLIATSFALDALQEIKAAG